MSDDDVVILQSMDGQEFRMEVKVAKMSETIKNLIEDAGVEQMVPLPNVTGKIFAKVAEYCKYHTEHPTSVVTEEKEKRTGDDIIGWDLDFTANVDQQTLFELILAANYLDIKDLLDLLCKTIAKQLVGKTPQQIKDLFGIKVDFTPEEEEEVRRENDWCEEK
jgi:S-phase kinase-associated protein 1